jgi:hypothetical protein
LPDNRGQVKLVGYPVHVRQSNATLSGRSEHRELRSVEA